MSDHDSNLSHISSILKCHSSFCYTALKSFHSENVRQNEVQPARDISCLELQRGLPHVFASKPRIRFNTQTLHHVASTSGHPEQHQCGTGWREKQQESSRSTDAEDSPLKTLVKIDLGLLGRSLKGLWKASTRALETLRTA